MTSEPNDVIALPTVHATVQETRIDAGRTLAKRGGASHFVPVNAIHDDRTIGFLPARPLGRYRVQIFARSRLPISASTYRPAAAP
jgi:hypothetical protein